MSENELSKLRKIIKYVLIKIGMRTDLVGFTYLCEAIEMVIQNPSLRHSICKGIYAKIAEKYNTKYQAIERDLRHSIDTTFYTKNFTCLNKLFKTNLYSVNDKPTVSELIILISEYFNLGLYKNDFDV